MLAENNKGSFKCYVTQMGVGGVRFYGKKRYEGVRFNVICVTRGWVGVQFPHKKRYVTLEWPLILFYRKQRLFFPPFIFYVDLPRCRGLSWQTV